MDGFILALDLGVRTGWCEGEPGRATASMTYLLKRAGDPMPVAFANLAAIVGNRLRAGDVTLVVKEEPFHLGAFAARTGSEAAVRAAYGYHAICEAMCCRHGVPCISVAPATVRKHFIGRGNAGDRKATKASVVARAKQLGYLPSGSFDDDRADACAVFDWASATHFRRAPEVLALFPDVARGKNR